MKIIFLLRTGVIEWPVPEDQLPAFNFIQVVSTVRMNGYFVGHNIYLRHDELVGMSMFEEGAAPAPAFKPTGSTLQ